MGEMYVGRSPPRSKKGTEDPVGYTNEEFYRLAHRHRPTEHERWRKQDEIILAHDTHAHRFIVDMDVARKHVQRGTDGSLLADHQCNRSEVGKPAPFCEPEAEIVDACGRRGRF